METPKRPSERDPDIIAASVDSSMDDVMRWLEDDKEDRANVRRQVIEAVSREADGYDRAQYMERRFRWSPDESLVEILGGISMWVAVQQATVKWVAENNVRPALAIGDTVRYHHASYGDGQPAGPIEIGTIASIDLKHATYGLPSPKGGEWVVRYEFVYPLKEEASA